MRFFLPLRFKILFTLLLGITVVVSVITFTMANLFHADKTAYIRNYISTSALNTATEARSLIHNYLGHTKTIARIAYDNNLNQDEKTVMLDDLFMDFADVLAISFFENGVERVSVVDEIALEEAGLSKSDFDDQRPQDMSSSNLPEAGKIFIRNSTIKAALPTITIVTSIEVPGRRDNLALEVLLRADALMDIVGRSELFEAFILEPRGRLLVHSDHRLAGSAEFVQWLPDGAGSSQRSSLVKTFEYSINDVDMIGGFAGVEVGQLTVGVQIPRTTAYLSARDLLNSLLYVSIVILACAAAISLIWSYRITRPLERLSKATKDVGRGEFDIHLNPTSHDEIGSLTSSVNQMASELREREVALQETQAALVQSEKMSAFGQLSAGIAHEVKNPLAGILGYVQLSLKKLKDNPSIRKNLVVIEKETRRCNAIIENLMKFARQDKPHLETLVINDVVEDSLTLVDHQMGLSNIKLEKHLGEALPEVRGDTNQLIQVFMNILINAQQAMDGEPGTITVMTETTDPDSVTVTIKDTGPGMMPETIEKIFEPFFTTKEAGKGTGLGLAVTYGIIKDHGGDIRVESEKGEGTAFIITLPVSADLSKGSDTQEAAGSADTAAEPESEPDADSGQTVES